MSSSILLSPIVKLKKRLPKLQKPKSLRIKKPPAFITDGSMFLFPYLHKAQKAPPHYPRLIPAPGGGLDLQMMGQNHLP